jgi:hypothetical protein
MLSDNTCSFLAADFDEGEWRNLTVVVMVAAPAECRCTRFGELTRSLNVQTR